MACIVNTSCPRGVLILCDLSRRRESVKLCDICECSLVGQGCISQSSIVYYQFHIQAVIEHMMDL